MLIEWGASLEVKLLVAFLLGLAVLPIASLLGWLKVKNMPEYWTLLEKYEILEGDYRAVEEAHQTVCAQVVRLQMSLKFEERAANATMFVVAEKQREINQLRKLDPETGKDPCHPKVTAAWETSRYWEREAMLRGDEKAKLVADNRALQARNAGLDSDLARVAKAYDALELERNNLKADNEIWLKRKILRMDPVAKKVKKVKAVRSGKR